MSGSGSRAVVETFRGKGMRATIKYSCLSVFWEIFGFRWVGKNWGWSEREMCSGTRVNQVRCCDGRSSLAAWTCRS